MADESKADRLRKARRNAGFRSASDAARSIGVRTPTYIHHENGTREFGEDAAKIYARRFHVSLVWLLLAEGEMQTPEEIRHQQSEKEFFDDDINADDDEKRREASKRWKEREERDIQDRLKQMAFVPVIERWSTADMKISPNYWSRYVTLTDLVFHRIIEHWAVPKTALNFYGTSPDYATLWPVDDDLNAPSFDAGDLVLVHTGIADAFTDGAYLIAEPGSWPDIRFLQRVIGSDPPSVIVTAESPKFQPQTVEVDSILIIGKVVGRFAPI